MKKLYRLSKTFVRQQGENDCGIACLAMILNYTGRSSELPLLLGEPHAYGHGLSLADLKTVAAAYGLAAKCVQLDLPFLRSNPFPCVLHFREEKGSGHYQVCYGRAAGGDFYLADPAKRLSMVTERELMAGWTGSALYFESLDFAHEGYRAWPSLLSLGLFPRIFWVLLPATHLVTALFGLALSWVLQRGLNYPLTSYRAPVLVLLTLLLFLVLLFKALLLYTRDRVLTHLDSRANCLLAATRQLDFREIHLIKDAYSLFIVVLLAEGNLILLSMTGLLFVAPLAFGCGLLYLAAIAGVTLFHLPEVNQQNASLNDLYAANMRTTGIPGISGRYLELSRQMAMVNSRIRLVYECMGILNLVAAFTIGLLEMYRQVMDYRSFLIVVILSYAIGQLAPKVGAAACFIDRGANTARQLLYRTGK
jgi:predicted double-glycine peptidase